MASVDDCYDFDAPRHYFDFNSAHDEPDDSYFDCPGENEVFDEQKPGSARQGPKTPVETPKRPNVASPPYSKAEKPKTPQSAVKSAKRENMMSSIGVRQSPRLAAIAKVQNPLCTPQAVRRSNASRQSLGSASSTGTKSSLGSQLNKVQKTKTQRPSVPKVPGMRGLSPRDQEELAVIANFKNKMAQNKKKGDNSVSSSHARSGRLAPTKPQEFTFATDSRLRNQKLSETESSAPSQAPPKPARHGPTRPKEFHFATDSRVKTHESAEDTDPVDFTRMLRSNQSASNKEKPKGPTIPQPFNLTESRKGKVEEGNKFVSVAELNLKFHTKTPQRFRSKRGGGSMEDLHMDGKKTKANPGVTIPHTPVLSTRSRTRQVNYLTHEEQEQREFEEAQKHAFKANPLNKKVFEPPSTGYEVEKKLPTVPEPFNITDVKKNNLPLGHNFREICNKLGGSTSSVASLPHGGIPSKWDKTSTKPQPFSFDERDKQKMQKKQEMIQKVLEEEKRLAEFHAQPMPVFEGVRGIPEKKPPTPTRQQPFNLASDYRGSLKQLQIKRSLEEQARLDREQREFRARSDAILHKQPFIPEKSKKPLTDISGFTLNTEIRSEERNEFEMHRKRKEDELLAAKREQEDRQAAEEAAEVARLRRSIVHKANPVPNYKPHVVKPSERHPTIPKSPNFSTDTRLRSRSRADSTMNISSATFTSE
ncbi:targeting protein for Xklp2-like isoform X1 [Penaeus indicus]|uniref:targeting protein for Xklp2-like isoform X1 n=1 Tax=Penaeus indicus TaxID=29960 RepID=UPI00300D7762